MTQTGLFFGSFNPIHVGHMIIASYMTEFTSMDEVWFVISPHNPLKEKKTLLSDYHRRSLVRIATEGSEKLKACDIEFGLPQPSYTVNTLAHLQERFSDNKFVLIMGEDNLASLHKWKNYKFILDNYEIYVYPRNNTGEMNQIEYSNVTMTEAPIMDISSSFIRKAISEKKEVRYMLPPKVYDYITEMHFYEK